MIRLLLVLSLVCIGFISAYAQAKKAENIVDEKGRKQGYWEKRDDKGYKLFQGQFKDNQPIGLMKQYHKGTDSLKALLNYRTDGSVYAILFNEVNYKKNAEGKYWQEKKDSIWQFFDESGQLISTEHYKKGKKDGKGSLHFPSGKLSESYQYVNDLKEGLNRKYYESGAIKSEQNYKSGLLEGLSIIYYPNKVEAARGYYSAGSKIHVWIYKNQDGSAENKEYWWEGIEVKESEYLKLKGNSKDVKESDKANAENEKPQQKKVNKKGKTS